MRKPASSFDRFRFHSLLKNGFEQIGLTDPARIGQLVATAQENPEREDMPYHPEVVTAWLEGRGLPSPAAFDAIRDLLGDQQPLNFEFAYDDAQSYLHENELGALLRGYFKRPGIDGEIPGMTCSKLSLRLYELGACSKKGSRKGQPLNSGTIGCWLTGAEKIPSRFLPVLDQLFPPEPPYASMTAIRLWEEPETHHWAEAANAKDIHTAFHHIRLALGCENGDKLAKGIAAESGISVSGRTVLNWEQPSDEYFPNARSFKDQNPIDVYCAIIRRINPDWLAQPSAAGGQTTNEEHFRHLFDEGLAAHNADAPHDHSHLHRMSSAAGFQR
jgi:hypothetical protein